MPQQELNNIVGELLGDVIGSAPDLVKDFLAVLFESFR